ncbi:MAG: sulfatase [Pirellulaceae bacterium]|jgi:arylsulfatase A-like enzyme
MNRWIWLSTFWLMTCLWCHARGDERPNIVFLLADDLGYGDLGCYGHPYAKTPSIDQLAREGTLFRSAYAAGPFCAPSRCGFMTGRFPQTFPVDTATAGFGSAVTVTETLKQKGYRTAHFGKWDIGKAVERGTYGIDEIQVIQSSHGDDRGKDHETTAAAIDFIRRSQGKPFYMNVWFHSVHTPVRPHPRFVDRFRDVQVHREDFSNPHFLQRWDDYEADLGDAVGGMKQYLGDLSQLDDQVGRVLAAIREAGIEQNTIVLFCSDNGPALSRQHANKNSDTGTDQVIKPNLLGSAGVLRGNKHLIYEGGVRIPWIVKWPNRVAAGKVDESSVVAGVDLLPTLCKIAGVEVDDPAIDGEDVSDIWLASGRQRVRDLFWVGPNPRVAIRRGKWKMHLRNEGIEELYDLSVDPEESSDLAASQVAVTSELGLIIDQWVKQLPKEAGVRPSSKNRSPKRDEIPTKLSSRTVLPAVLAVASLLIVGGLVWRRWRH